MSKTAGAYCDDTGLKACMDLPHHAYVEARPKEKINYEQANTKVQHKLEA